MSSAGLHSRPSKATAMAVRMAITRVCRNNAGEDMEKRGPWNAPGGQVNWCCYYGNQRGGLSEN